MTDDAARAASSADTAFRFCLTVTMDSDWHIGIGAGRNRTVDRLVDRDEDGLPVIRSTTLRGIWRDGAELLARGLDQSLSPDPSHGKRPWARFVDELLGSEPQIEGLEPHKDFKPPLASRVRLGDARIEDTIRKWLAPKHPGCAALREAMTFIKPGVKIDPGTGMALDDHLRFEEVARGGAVLQAKGSLEVADKDKAVAAAFLVGAAAFIERLGGKRRRGMGRCRVDVRFQGAGFPNDVASAAAILENPDNLNPPAMDKSDHRLSAGSSAASAGGTWLKLDLRLKLRSPVIIPDAVLGNVVTTLDHIPGSQLLPHVARALERTGFTREVVGRLIAAGDLRVLPAYPEIDGSRAIPVPFSWRQPKLGGQLSSGFEVLKEGEPQQKPLRAGYVAPNAATFSKARIPKKVIRTHNTVEDARQKPTEAVGGVYSYEALSPGQKYRSEVWVRADGLEEEKLKAALNERAHIGRARKAGYGEVKVEAVGKPDDVQTKSPGDGITYVLLETDALLRVPDLGPGSELEALLSALHAGLGQVSGDVIDSNTTKAEIRTRRSESWHTGWGLPRPSLIALQAGSVVKLGGIEPTPGQIKALESEGIGERRAEGYGRVRVNPKLVIEMPEEDKTDKGKKPDEPPTDPIPIKGLSDPERDFLTLIERIAWERTIAQRAEHFATNGEMQAKLKWKGRKPPMSQLGALRAIMGRYETVAEVAAAEAWCKKLAGHMKADDKWPKDGVKELGGLLGQNGARTAWSWLFLPGTNDVSCTTWGGAAVPGVLLSKPEEMCTKLGRVAIRSLLHAAMRAHKRAIEEREKKGEPEPADEEAGA